MCLAALELYEATGTPSYLEYARSWVEHVELHYHDPNGGYFFTADDAEALIARAKIAEEAALPSGNGMLLQVLAQLYHLTGESVYRERAEGIAKAFSGDIRQRVLGFSSLLTGMEMLREAVQIVVIGEANTEDTAALRRVIYGVSRPGRIFSVIAPGTALPRAHPAFGKTFAGESGYGLCLPGNGLLAADRRSRGAGRGSARSVMRIRHSNAAYPRRHALASQGCAPRGAVLGL